jgi:hypothetical protein
MIEPKPLSRFAAPLLMLVVLVAAGCGGSSNASSAPTNTTSQDAARIKYTQCLRDNGIDVPDNPTPGGRRFGNVDQAKLRKAQTACRKYQQAVVGNITPAQRQAFQDAFAKFASCMRQHGVDLPPRTPGQGPPAGGAQINRNDPKVQAAQKACQSKLPQGGRGRFGGGGGNN